MLVLRTSSKIRIRYVLKCNDFILQHASEVDSHDGGGDRKSVKDLVLMFSHQNQREREETSSVDNSAFKPRKSLGDAFLEKIRRQEGEKDNQQATPIAPKRETKGSIFDKQRAIEASQKFSHKSNLSEEPNRRNIFKAPRNNEDPMFAELTGPKGTNGLLNNMMIQNLSSQKDKPEKKILFADDKYQAATKLLQSPAPNSEITFTNQNKLYNKECLKNNGTEQPNTKIHELMDQPEEGL